METINFLIGTPYVAIAPRIVLLVEATAEEATLPRLRRALVHLGQAGVLDKTQALLIGRSPDAQACWKTDLREVVLSVTSDYEFPIIADVPFGHTDPMMTLPLGAMAEIVVGDGSLTIHRG